MSISRYRIGFATIEAITSYPAQLWLGASDCAAQLGINLITYGGFPKQEAKVQGNEGLSSDITTPFLRLIDLQALDGIIVWTAGILEDHSQAEQFLAPFRSVPLVSIGVDMPGTACVLLDNYQGMSDMVTHLITDCGRRNLAFITGTSTNLDAQVRLQAYQDTLKRHGLPVREDYIVPGAFGWKAAEAGKKAARELIEQRNLPIDAIVAASDDLALGAIEYMRQQGIAVPDQIAISGFDNIPEGLSTFPKLTTVAQNAYELAWQAVTLMMAKIEGRVTNEHRVIPNRILIRDSCGARQTKNLPNPQGTGQEIVHIESVAHAQDHEHDHEQSRTAHKRADDLKTQQQLVELRILNRNLMISYDQEHLMKILAQQLPLIGIDLLYVALFHSFEQLTDEVRLVIAYDSQNKLAETPDNQFVKLSELTSGRAILHDRLMNLILLPLYSNDVYAGFVIFSFGPRDYQVYTQLGDILGYTIVNGRLLEKVRNYANELEVRITERTADLVATNNQLQAEIAERVRIEQQLEQARDQALEVARLKSEFLATMSHEIRTPMNGIMGMTELLLETKLDDEQIEYATVAYEESKRLLSIINDILDFSKIEAGKLILENAEFSLTETVQSVSKLLSARAEEKGIALFAHIASDLPQTVEGDSTRLRQVLINLVSNAIKFTTEGDVVIRLSKFKSDDETLLTRNGKAAIPIQIIVRDTGIGMGEQTIKRLFEAFIQADSSTTRRYGGTGLGLAISKRLINLMGGEIEVESELGRGSTFSIILPMEIGKHSLTQPAKTAPINTHEIEMLRVARTSEAKTMDKHAQILLAEDHANNQRVATARLKKLGYHVEVVETGCAAVSALLDQQHGYQLVLMDWQMPEMDGLEATRRIRQAEAANGGHIPIIGMTANAMMGDREICLASGMDDYLSKPINSNELQRLLDKWLG